ncbi:hypothetical protein Nepgr_033725 [Nepenthes gracilis]|uniref:Uncharacterized protein n=1 Tax=Nepenthes gracilis TaxID=150966 RepID=A0AAD3TMG8_NEPGR|nr:hypothetical protein Nepgr_033725 [Nepenthes gracilis]
MWVLMQQIAGMLLDQFAPWWLRAFCPCPCWSAMEKKKREEDLAGQLVSSSVDQTTWLLSLGVGRNGLSQLARRIWTGVCSLHRLRMLVWCHADVAQLSSLAELRVRYAVSLAGMVLAVWWACRDMFLLIWCHAEQIGPCSLQRAWMKISVISAFDRGTCKMP